MCATCGCGEETHEHEHGHEHDGHGEGHGHGHVHGAEGHGHTVSLERDILAKNNLLAERNRGWLDGRGIFALNVMSSPGAGKTTLLEKTITNLRLVGSELTISVVEGDQATLRDAERIQAAGAKAIQINTGTGCHLDARMLADALPKLAPAPRSLLVIENVGNLVCPALFDLGENLKVVLVSVTEGDDKPLKYPHMFRAADVLVLNKIDLLPYVSFDSTRFFDDVGKINPRVRSFQISATRGDGLDAWCSWLTHTVQHRH